MSRALLLRFVVLAAVAAPGAGYAQTLPPLETKRWEETTASKAQSARACIEAGFKLIGGGARVNGTDTDSVLVASYPEGTCWLARARDDHATLTVWAIGLLDRGDEWDVQVHHAIALSSTLPKATASLQPGYALTGGGGRIAPDSRGLTASYPASIDSWEVVGAEQISLLGSATSYVIGIRPRGGGSVPTGLTRASGLASQAPSVAVFGGYTLTGGGAAVTGAVNVLRSSFPDGDAWRASSNLQDASALARITVYAVGIKPPAVVPPPPDGPLSVVEIAAPAVNCLFAPNCVLQAVDTTSNAPLSAISLHSRTFAGAAGAPGAGKTGYLYRVSMGVGSAECVAGLVLNFGAVTRLPYQPGALADVFVITAGETGTIKLKSAERAGDFIDFAFDGPLCPPADPTVVASTFFFGLASAKTPELVPATIYGYGNPPIYPVDARAPMR